MAIRRKSVKNIKNIMKVNDNPLKICLSNSQGIGNRIKFIASCIRINKLKDIDLYWPQNGWVPTSFKELFNFDWPYPINEFDQELIKKNIPLKPPLSYTEGCRLYVNKRDGLPNNFSKLYFPSKNGYGIDFEYNRIPQKILNIYLPFFKRLKPSTKVKKRLKDTKLPKKFVGLQIRNNKDWFKFGRNENLGLFCNEINKYPKSTKFYLSCMSQSISKIVHKKYPNQIIELPHKNYISMIDAVTDMYNLSKASAGIYSYGSSFSEVAWWIGKCRQTVTVVGSFESWRTAPINSEKTIYYYIDKNKIKNPEKHIKTLTGIVDKFIYKIPKKLSKDADNVLIEATNTIPSKKTLLNTANHIHQIQFLEKELSKTKHELFIIKNSKFFNLWQKFKKHIWF